MKIHHLILSYILIFTGYCCQAATVQGLYEGTVPIVDKTSQSQTQGIRAALLQTLVKLTGKRNAAGIYGVDAILQEPKRYLQQYRIRTRGQQDAAVEPEYFLWAKFDANAVQSALGDYSIPIWSQERPETLIWFAVNEGEQGLKMPQMDSGEYFHDSLQYRANARGIGLSMPLLDATDRAQLTAEAIASRAVPAIQTASQRYLSDAVLSATANRLGQDLWQINWLSIINGQTAAWETSGSTAAEAIGEGIDAHADKLAAIYSQPVGYAGESRFDIRISGITNFDAYANTLRYLQSLNFISQVMVKQVEDTTITYGLVTRGDISRFEQAISLGQTIRPGVDGETFQYVR